MRRLAKEVTVLLLVGLLLLAGVGPALADTNLELGSIAIIANTDSEMVMVRAGVGYEYEVLGMVGEGDIVTVIDGPFEGDDGNYWYQVDANGQEGYIFAGFLVLPENAPAHPVRSRTAAEQTLLAATGGGYLATVTGTDGDGARLRDGAGIDSAIVLLVPEGAAVEVVGDPQSSDGHHWYPIVYDGAAGWLAGDFLGDVALDGAADAQLATDSGASAARGPVFDSGSPVQISGTGTDDVRIRAAAGVQYDIVGHAPANAVLLLVGGPEVDDAGNAWFIVDYDGLTGYMAADFLAWTDQALSARQTVTALTVTTPDPPVAVAAPPAPKQQAAPPPPPEAATSDHSDALVSVAMRYLGSPYVWGGSSPGGFDCSGFTSYVARQAAGRNIGRTVEAQLGAGRAVSAKELQPGDLVFFVNTYQPGLSHVGIYIGGGQMIQAGSERTGVTTSNIWDSYWGPRYYAARRL